MRAVARALLSLLGVVVALFAATASADEAAMSRFHYDQATRHYDRGQYERAVQQFFLAQRMSPNPRTVYNIGLCFHQLRRHEDAFLFLSEYLDLEDTADGAEARQRYARETIAKIATRVARVHVESSPEGARIFVDQREHGAWGVAPRTLALRPGAHRVWVELEGHRPAAVEVEAVRGALAKVVLVPERILGRLALRAPVEAGARVVDAQGEVAAEGAVPLEVALAPGRYEVEVTAPGYRPYRGTVRIHPERETLRRAALEPLPPPRGALTVSANVNRAVVELDGEPLGFTPLALTDLAEGPRHLRVTSPDMLPWEGTVDVRSGSQAWAQVELAKRPTGASPSAWAVGSIGVGMLVAGGITGAAAIKTRSSFTHQRHGLAPDGSQLRSLRDRGITLNRATDTFVGLGLVALGIGITVYLLTDDRGERHSRARVSGKASP